MRSNEQSSLKRGMLFTKLAALEQAGIPWDRLFELVGQDCPPVYQAKLQQLSTGIRSGTAPTAELLRRSELFLPWEMSLMLVGLGVGKSQSVFQRLSRHYGTLHRAWSEFRNQAMAPLALLFLASFIAAFIRVQQEPISSLVFAAHALWPTLLVVGLFYTLLTLTYRQQARVNAWFLPSFLNWFPTVRSLNTSVSLYHYLMNLALCIQAGLPLMQTLNLCAKAESNPVMRDRYQRVALDVQAGQSLSQAFKNSHLLDETRLLSLAKTGEATGTLESAQARIAEIVKESFEEQLLFLARWLPRGLYLLVPLVWLA